MSSYTLGLIVLVYVFALAGLSWLGFRHTKNAKDMLTGGGNMNTIVMALSYGATFISASAIVGFGGVAAAFGMGIQWLCLLNIFMGVIIAFILFGKRTRRLGAQLHAHTFPQLLGKHFKSKPIQVLTAAIIVLGMPLYAAVVLKGGAVFVEQIFEIDYNIALFIFTLIIALYVITGGMKGVMYTSAFQAIVMFLCMGFLFFFLYRALGMGFTEANQALTDMQERVPAHLAQIGHQGWTAMPLTGSPQWYTLVTSLILGVGIGCLAQPQLVVRFLTVRSSKQLNQGVFVGSLFLLVTVGAVYHAGALSNLFFMKTTGKIAVEYISDIDKIIPAFINASMPKWFTAVFMLSILSASMSTLSSQVHVMGTSAATDIYADAIKNNEAKNTTYIIRVGIFVSILLSYLVCYVLEEGVIARGTAIFMGLCAASFLPAYVASLYWPRCGKRAAFWSMVTGAGASVFALLFLHQKEAAAVGLCRWLFGRDVLIEAYPWPVVDPIIIALPLATLVLIVLTYLQPKSNALIDKV